MFFWSGWAKAAWGRSISALGPVSANEKQVSCVGPALGQVHQVAFAADGRHLGTANGNGTVYILRLAPPSKP